MGDWRAELSRLAAGADANRDGEANRSGIGPDAVAEQFLRRTGMEALQELAEQLRELGREVRVAFLDGPPRVTLSVHYDGREEMEYALRVRRRGDMAYAYAEASHVSPMTRKRYTYGRYVGGHQLDHTIVKITREEIIDSFMNEYRHVCTPRRR